MVKILDVPRALVAMRIGCEPSMSSFCIRQNISMQPKPYKSFYSLRDLNLPDFFPNSLTIGVRVLQGK